MVHRLWIGIHKGNLGLAAVAPGMSLCATTGPAARPPDTQIESVVTHDESCIRERLEACRQGMIQLGILRTKHLRMMEDMRGRLPLIPSCGDVRSREKRFEAVTQQRESIRSEDSGRASIRDCVDVSRAHSPLADCISHRSSLSMDSGCSSVRDSSVDTLVGALPLQPFLTYTAFRKQSLEETPIIISKMPAIKPRNPSPPRVTPRARKAMDYERRTADQILDGRPEDIHLLTTTIESTTSLRRNANGGTRPRSMYATYEAARSLERGETKRQNRSRSPPMLDSRSFSALTPPPIHRKFGVAQNIDPNEQITISPKAAPRKHVPTQEVLPIQAVRRQQIKPDEGNRDPLVQAARQFLERSPKMQKRRFSSQDPARPRPKSMFETDCATDCEPISTIFSAQPAKVLSRQVSHATPETSPVGARRLTVAAGIARFEAHVRQQQQQGNRRDKPWHESKALMRLRDETQNLPVPPPILYQLTADEEENIPLPGVSQGIHVRRADKQFPIRTDEVDLLSLKSGGLKALPRSRLLRRLAFFSPCQIKEGEDPCSCAHFVHPWKAARVGNPFARLGGAEKRISSNHEKRLYLRESGHKRITLSIDALYPPFGTPCRSCSHELLGHSAHLLIQDDVVLAKMLSLSEMAEKVVKRMNWMKILQDRSWCRRRLDLDQRLPPKVSGLDLQTFVLLGEMLNLLLLRIQNVDPDLEWPVHWTGMPPFYPKDECSIEEHLQRYLWQESDHTTAGRVAACEFLLERINSWNPGRAPEFAYKMHQKKRQNRLTVLRAFRVMNNRRSRAEAEEIVQQSSEINEELREINAARETLNQLNRAGFDLMRARHFWWCRLPQIVPILPIYQPVQIFGKRFVLRALRQLQLHLVADAFLMRGQRFAQIVAEVIEFMKKEPYLRKDQMCNEGTTTEKEIDFKFRLCGEKRAKNTTAFYAKWLNGEKPSLPGDIDIKDVVKAAYLFAKQRRRDAKKVQSKNGDPLIVDVARADDVFEEELSGHIQFRVIQNRVDTRMPQNILYYLSQLLQLYSVALPKMPREYITRLIYDTRHMNMVIIKPDRGVIGGICFRAFLRHGFSEIVFCAVTADEQVKGYGTHLMNHVKEFHAQSLQIYHLMTYADKLAIGYFSKQGFTTDIPIPQENYKGFIKDYDGATLMACHLHPQIPYTHYAQFCMVERDLIREAAKVIYPDESQQVTRAGIEHLHKEYAGSPVPLNEIVDLELESSEELPHKKDYENKIRQILNKLKQHADAWPFLEPVDAVQVPEYYSYIKQPIDLQTMAEKLKGKHYGHEALFLADLRRMFDNCYRFNGVETEYYRMGYVVNKLALNLVETAFPNLPDWHPKLPDLKPILYVETDEEESSEE
ncbi:unnamed protein product, partial [Mesorhabditis belari]|uniref:histone acetyltransferase n=1 Tax=Mesorhabditis belari TaxID=2138241 RepID=A0AAF3EJZ2_9BILA